MSMKNGKLQPWQIFQAARKYLGPAVVSQIFGKANARSAYDWAQDPATTEHRCKSPLEAMHAMFERLDAVGMGYVARAALAYLQSAVDDGADGSALVEPRPTINEELLADYEAVAGLQAAVSRCAELEDVIVLVQAAKDEIDRTYARYCRDCGER